MEALEGKIIMDLGISSGTSKVGNPWKKRELVLETFGQYPKKVKFTIFGENRVDSMQFEVGKNYSLSFDLESREFNGKWYTDVNVFRAVPMAQEPGGGNPMGGGYPGNYGGGQGTTSEPGGNFGNQSVQFGVAEFEVNSGDSDEDLPF